MNDFILKGKVEVDGMKFNHIEGGFGENKKAMLAKDIATIHGRALKDINRNINNNIQRFKIGIDLIDLKNGGFGSPLYKLGFSSRDISISNNIYLLSERGYSKLLKILEDDFAWKQYDKLVDGYFNMRQTLQEQTPQIDSKFMYQLAQTLEEKEKQIATMKPKARFADAITTSKQSVLVGELAKVLARNGVEGVGQNRLFKWLRLNGFLHKRGEQYNLPTQKSIELEVMEVKVRTINNPDGSVRVTKTPKITGKGQVYFVNRFLKNEIA